MVALQDIQRHRTQTVLVGNIGIGGQLPVVVQSMTNTDTADVVSTVEQIGNLARAGSEIVRITVNNLESAKAVPDIRNRLDALGLDVPIVGDFHYNGHRLLEEVSELAPALAKLRINPGNVGFGSKRDPQFEQMIEKAIKHQRPVRIGVNWGSLDQALAAALMDDNARRNQPKNADFVLREALISSALQSAKFAEKLGLGADKIVVSAKVSRAQDLISVYRQLAARSSYALHLGLTEAGLGSKGIVASSVALSVLLQEGIGDTIRVSLTPKPSESRTTEVKICQDILQALGLRSFAPQVTACPGCGRTTSTYFQELTLKIELYLAEQMPVWRSRYSGIETMKIAVMGCIVNGPGESKHADVGISLPGTGEQPSAPVFIDGQKALTLHGPHIAEEFQAILEDYVERRYGHTPAAAE